MENETMYDIALGASPLVMIMGVVFMATCNVFWRDFLKLPTFQTIDQTHKDFLVWGGVMAHLFFILGTVAFQFGGLHLGLPRRERKKIWRWN